MYKTKILYGIILLLILLNSSILVILLHNPPPPIPPRWEPKNPKEIIINKLKLDAQQQVLFEKSMRKHHAQITALENQINAIQKNRFELVASSQVDTMQKYKLLKEILLLQAQIEQTHWEHFTEIKQLCHPNQMNDFKEVMQTIPRFFSKEQPPHPRHDN